MRRTFDFYRFQQSYALYILSSLLMLARICIYLWILLLIYLINCEDTESNEYRSKLLHSFMTSQVSVKSQALGDILVIVHSNYNSSLIEIQSYIKLWKPSYPHVLFFGNWNAEELQHLRSHNLPVFRCPDNDGGFLAQNVMLKALHKFQLPMFKGYLYIHDDLVLNPLRVQLYDKSKFWIADYRKHQKLNDLPGTVLTTLNYNDVQKVWSQLSLVFGLIGVPDYTWALVQKVLGLALVQ